MMSVVIGLFKVYIYGIDGYPLYDVDRLEIIVLEGDLMQCLMFDLEYFDDELDAIVLIENHAVDW